MSIMNRFAIVSSFEIKLEDGPWVALSLRSGRGNS